MSFDTTPLTSVEFKIKGKKLAFSNQSAPHVRLDITDWVIESQPFHAFLDAKAAALLKDTLSYFSEQIEDGAA